MSGQKPAAHGDAIGRALRDLARHRPDRALEPLRAAVDACPALRKVELSRRLYWLAVALLRLDRTDLAIKSLASAQKLRPRGLARDVYVHRVNAYGMPRRASPELDDFWAFYSLQACVYLATRPGRRFAAAAEKDLVTRTIAAAWMELRRSGKLLGRNIEERLALFKAMRLDFPMPVGLGGRADLKGRAGLEGRVLPLSERATSLSGAPEPSHCADPLKVDFRRGKKVKATDRCPCGSGLPYCQCCGRTKSPLELGN
ncbi:MAG: SEC-C domain-containing protein [Treponema sp.]|nr:SEC-C domain-containing protein [Treponema sp.]